MSGLGFNGIERTTDISGTFLLDHVTATYDQLVTTFGPPCVGPDDLADDKITCEWRLRFNDGSIATIYDWKNRSTPRGSYSWHVGGKKREGLWNVIDALGRTTGEKP